MQTIKDRSPVAAGFLNAILPGLGLLYAGRPALAVAQPIVSFLLILIFSSTKMLFSPGGALWLVILLFAVWVGAIFFAARCARRRPITGGASYRRWYVYVGFVVLSAATGHELRINRDRLVGYDVFRIPSSGMDDTLHIGDFIVVDTWRYQRNDPQRGDIVVFQSPANPAVKYVKRIIGLPGETVMISNGVVKINGHPLNERYVDPARNVRHFRDGLMYQVPKSEFFVLGDYRDNSNDSRVWGAVPKRNVSGRVEFIWMSYASGAGVRVDRIGMRIR